MVTVLEQQPDRAEPRGAEAERSNRGFLVVIGVLAAVVVVLGAMLVFGGRSSTAPSPEIEQLIVDYMETIEDQDKDALTQLVTPDYSLRVVEYLQATDRLVPMFEEEDLAGVDLTGLAGWEIERLELSVTGENPWFVVAIEDWDGGGVPYVGGSIFTVVEHDGELKIAARTWIGKFTRVE